MEDALLYTIDIRATSGSGPSFEVDGYQCEWAVTVSGQGRSLTPLYDRDCSLLRAVVALLPAHEAAGTRESAVGCRNQ
jgi:hypothetical protein